MLRNSSNLGRVLRVPIRGVAAGGGGGGGGGQGAGPPLTKGLAPPEEI